MIQRRFTLGILSFSIVVATAGCSEKAVPTPLESAVQKDREISETIMSRIDKDVALSDDKGNFQVMTVNGETTIYGVVDSELERSHAEQMATEVSGVKAVTSRIKLKNQQVQTASR